MQNSKTEFIRFVMAVIENNSSDEEKTREYFSSEGLNADAMVSETEKRIKRLQMELNAQKTSLEMDAANDVREEAEALVDELLSKRDFSLASSVQEEELTFSFRNMESLSKEDIRNILVKHYTLKLLHSKNNESAY
jgi:hypothetical protein